LEALSKQQLLELLAAARAHRERDWLMILVGYSHGLRASEVVGIRADDVADGFLSVRRLKGSNFTVQPLIHDCEPLLDEAPALVDLARRTPGNQFVFPVTRRQFGRIVVRHAGSAAIPRHLAHPHILKHSIAMQTIQSAGIENVRQYLGHKSISSTGAYLKVSDSEAAAAIQKGLAGLKDLI
jgi:type 1 fimbriae regulatory protein FimB